MLLSVVIPFYHVEAYIGACLERAAKIAGPQCEILLVDDCGSDGSAEIARTYCERYAHMRIIRREKNGGLSAARNTGLAEAKGEYVYFLDSDDLPEPYALMGLVHQAHEMQLDVAKARFAYLDDGTLTQTPGPMIERTQAMPGSALFAAQCAKGVYEPMVWQCVYRRAFLQENSLTMAEGLLFEDELFQAPALLRAERAAAFDACILLYRQREGSIMGSFARSSRWCASYLEVCRRLWALGSGMEKGAARAALRRRVGQIALSTAKNIAAYRLPQKVAGEAKAFVMEHKRELAGYAVKSGDMLVAAQGLLLGLSLRLFLAAYKRK